MGKVKKTKLFFNKYLTIKFLSQLMIPVVLAGIFQIYLNAAQSNHSYNSTIINKRESIIERFAGIIQLNEEINSIYAEQLENDISKINELRRNAIFEQKPGLSKNGIANIADNSTKTLNRLYDNINNLSTKNKLSAFYSTNDVKIEEKRFNIQQLTALSDYIDDAYNTNKKILELEVKRVDQIQLLLILIQVYFGPKAKNSCKALKSFKKEYDEQYDPSPYFIYMSIWHDG